jgi:hypothetical protein
MNRPTQWGEETMKKMTVEVSTKPTPFVASQVIINFK